MWKADNVRSLPSPGYSVWNPYGIHGIHQEFHMESMWNDDGMAME